MTGLERIRAAFHRQPVDRTPWVPFVGVHGGYLLDITATEYLKSADRLVEGIEKSIELYAPDGVPVAFDLQIEAEILGCKLNWSDDTPPAVISHPLTEGVALADLAIPAATDGRIPVVLDATRRLRAAHPDLALYGLITGPFTLALHLMGTDIFMKMFDKPEYVNEVMAFAAKVCNALSDYYIEAGCDIVAVVDPMTSQIGPDQFQQFVTAPATEVFEHIRTQGAMSSFFVCGHAEQNLKVMCDCKCDNVSVDENIPLTTIRDICLAQDVSFGGNMQLTAVLLLGSELDSQRNALDCLDIGGETGFILAPGCDLPYDTPAANLQAVTRIVVDKYEREKVAAMDVEENTGELLDMSQYGQSDKVVVDIITLDSEACAPCQYMVESVKDIMPEFEGIVEWREHKIKQRENLVFMSSLLVRNIPTICIDGQIRFVSRIPSRDELSEAIQKRILEKMRIRIRQEQGEVFVLCGAECEGDACKRLSEVVERVITELGADVKVTHITDPEHVRQFGVLPGQTPAIVTANYRLRSTKQVPEASVLREWIKDLM